MTPLLKALSLAQRRLPLLRPVNPDTLADAFKYCLKEVEESLFNRYRVYKERLVLDDVFLVSVPLEAAIDVNALLRRVTNLSINNDIPAASSRRMGYALYARLEPLLDAAAPFRLYLRHGEPRGVATHLHMVCAGNDEAKLRTALAAYAGATVARMGGYCTTKETLYDQTGKCPVGHGLGNGTQSDTDAILLYHRTRKLVALLA